jgi:hypothetical protein
VKGGPVRYDRTKGGVAVWYGLKPGNLIAEPGSDCEQPFNHQNRFYDLFNAANPDTGIYPIRTFRYFIVQQSILEGR